MGFRKNRISNSRPALVCPPGLLPALCWCGPTSQQGVFSIRLCCDTEQDRLVRRVGSGVLKGLRVTSLPHQTVRAEYHRLLLSDRDTEPAVCLSAAGASVSRLVMKLLNNLT